MRAVNYRKLHAVITSQSSVYFLIRDKGVNREIAKIHC